MTNELMLRDEVALTTATTSTKTLRVLLGSTERRGAWAVPSRLAARVTLGHMQLDLREAELGEETTIDAQLTLGNLEILVPPDVAVDIDVRSFAASVSGPAGHGMVRLPDRGGTWHGSVPYRDAAFLQVPRRLRIVGNVRFGSCEVIACERGPT